MEKQRLEEEREAILACLAICKMAADQVAQYQAKDQSTPGKGRKNRISSLPELINGGRAGHCHQHLQTTIPCGTSTKSNISRSQLVNTTCRQRANETESTKTSGPERHEKNCVGFQEPLVKTDSMVDENLNERNCEDKGLAAGDESFVVVENTDDWDEC